MPYNNTPIAPSQEVSGQVSLPLARVQKIINADAERGHVSKNAAFAIAIATEMFIQHLAVTTHNVVKAERKPRRNIQYRDVASAVAKTDNLEFLVDVVPRTMTYREYKQKQAASGKAVGKTSNAAGTDATAGGSENIRRVNGNGSLEKGTETPQPKEDKMDVDGEETESGPEDEEEDGAAMQLEMEMRSGRTNGTSPFVDRRASAAEANGSS